MANAKSAFEAQGLVPFNFQKPLQYFIRKDAFGVNQKVSDEEIKVPCFTNEHNNNYREIEIIWHRLNLSIRPISRGAPLEDQSSKNNQTYIDESETRFMEK